MKRGLLTFFFGVVVMAAAVSYPYGEAAGTDVHVGINIVPPHVVFSAPPSVVVIPGTYAYFIPGIKADIFFYDGYWYRPYRSYWYRAHRYDGPWVYIEPRRVPGPVLHVPHDFRHLRPGYERIPYGHLKKNWKKWQRERHWDRHERGHGREKGRGRH
ncbi:MAG: hypothetical protein P8013_10020 [Candidatus Sulfobium sp.]